MRRARGLKPALQKGVAPGEEANPLSALPLFLGLGARWCGRREGVSDRRVERDANLAMTDFDRFGSAMPCQNVGVIPEVPRPHARFGLNVWDLAKP